MLFALGTYYGMDSQNRRRGYTLVELLVASACSVLLIAVLVAIAHAAVAWGNRSSQTVTAKANLDRLADRWYANAATAWSVFTPPTDVFGNANVDGHEFDLATVNSQREPSFLAYDYNPAKQQLVEYTYGKTRVHLCTTRCLLVQRSKTPACR
jgi:type II secretory pathway pseudopilin PulG